MDGMNSTFRIDRMTRLCYALFDDSFSISPVDDLITGSLFVVDGIEPIPSKSLE